MDLPFAPPLDPMLAKLADDLPEGAPWIYEPKWDGFRALLFHGDTVAIQSRDGRDLVRYFPELVDLVTGRTPPGSVLDGEVVVAARGRFDFDSLSLRLHPAASRVERLAGDIPAALVLFDVLALEGEDVTARPLAERLEQLERLAPLPKDPAEVLDALAAEPSGILATPRTNDVATARPWLTAFEERGLDGVVAKRLDRPYLFGKRDMVKVKPRRTADCVVGGFRRAKSGEGVGSLLLGLYDDAGVLQYVGHTSGLKAAERLAVRERLRPLEGGTSFGGGRTPGGPSRWAAGRDPAWVPVDPRLVVEVRYDRIMNGRFRHAVGLERWRDDKRPEECTFEQV